jgi:hypothetical protein
MAVFTFIVQRVKSSINNEKIPSKKKGNSHGKQIQSWQLYTLNEYED